MGTVVDETQVDTAVRVARRWRRIRWAAAVFCIVQFAMYAPSPGVRPPYPLLPIGLGLAVLIALMNSAATAAERWLPRRPREEGRPARRDLLLLAGDTGVVIAVVEVLAFDPAVAARPWSPWSSEARPR